MQGFPTTYPACVPFGCRVYAIGDIHGRLDLLTRLLDSIATDAASTPAEQIAIIFLGDYIDRGPHSSAVIDKLKAGPPSTGPLANAQWIVLRGNHEDTMLRFLEDLKVGHSWCVNGGIETIQSYAGPLDKEAASDMSAMQLLLQLNLPPTHLRFLSRLPLSFELGDYLFVHAGIRPGVRLADQSPTDMMWIRDPFLHSRADHGKIVVHGHTISKHPEIRSNRIGIDTGAYSSDCLTALVLEGADRHFLSTGNPSPSA